uniref:Defensin-like protein n=1 Tax=Acrobeloides nanus TaxID=290746 RepID=A0A914ELP8_9BILA
MDFDRSNPVRISPEALSGTRFSKPFAGECSSNKTCDTACIQCSSNCKYGFCTFNELEGNETCYCSPFLCC